MNMDRKAWRERWLDGITEISALDWQRRYWGKVNNPHYGFVECVVCYFDDCLHGGGYEKLVTAGMLSFDEAFAVAEMHLKLDAYLKQVNLRATKDRNALYDHQAILSDSAWIEVTEAARRARRRLLKLIKEPRERELLLHAEPDHP